MNIDQSLKEKHNNFHIIYVCGDMDINLSVDKKNPAG